MEINLPKTNVFALNDIHDIGDVEEKRRAREGDTSAIGATEKQFSLNDDRPLMAKKVDVGGERPEINAPSDRPMGMLPTEEVLGGSRLRVTSEINTKNAPAFMGALLDKPATANLAATQQPATLLNARASLEAKAPVFNQFSQAKFDIDKRVNEREKSRDLPGAVSSQNVASTPRSLRALAAIPLSNLDDTKAEPNPKDTDISAAQIPGKANAGGIAVLPELENEELENTSEIPIEIVEAQTSDFEGAEGGERVRGGGVAVLNSFDITNSSLSDNGLLEQLDSAESSENRIDSGANQTLRTTFSDNETNTNTVTTLNLTTEEVIAGELSSPSLASTLAPASTSKLEEANITSAELKSQLETHGAETTTTPQINIADIIAASTAKIHTIPIGQSLEQVAEGFGLNVFDLLRANPQLLKDPMLFAGQKVKVPQEQLSETSLLKSQTNGTNLFNTEQAGLKSSLLQPTKATLEPLSVLNTEKLASLKPELVLAENQRTNTISRSAEASPNTKEALEREKAINPDKVPLKQNEGLITGLGIVGNVDAIQIEADNRQKRERHVAMPEPFDEWADMIYDAAELYNLSPALIAGIIWCESSGKNVIGKDGHGHGLMQIDDRKHKLWLAANANGLDPASNIVFGASLLRKNIDYFGGKLAAGVAAYDCSIDLVEEAMVLGKPVDHFTTEGNYSLRVLNQQDHFRRFFGS